ncbi:hypothetical protein CLIB1444_08S01926 [[Candida] jaroonii]|uniref:Uncharacterized protein n=1 Tax=[Candida] jaroonii TaxID=467808 RepID=A0ACA9YAL0_9ASCO|nr:hypothetical protein CLIB1444_08S01926 [[Candida] jaroonii]
MDDEKICQWYCCDCGQSYGTIIYKDKNVKKDSPNADVKYYSSMLYNNNIIIDYKDFLSPTIETQEDDYFKVRTVDLNNSKSRNQKIHQQIKDHININDHHDHHNNSNNTLDNQLLHNQSSSSNQKEYTRNDSLSSEENDSELDELLINGPKRFSCHRCQHMMCPYCPKLRYKDL